MHIYDSKIQDSRKGKTIETKKKKKKKRLSRKKEEQTGRAQRTLGAVKLFHQLCDGGYVTLCI